jgi:hypothetical protein
MRLPSTTRQTAVALCTLLVLGADLSSAFAKEYNLRRHNNGSYAAACDRSATCINWGGGVYTNGDTKVICTKSKCTMYEDDPPT